MGAAAVFWDRDDTLIRDPGYLRDPDGVELLPGAAEALRRVADAGYQNIICTNQSGVARGLMDEATVEVIHERLREQLRAAGASLDAVYYCPFLAGEEAVVEQYRQDSDLRKPRPGMLVKASLEHNIDLAASWSIGDSIRDAQAGRAAGCRTILIAGPDAEGASESNPAVDFVARSVLEAADIVLRHTLSRSAAPARPAASDESAAVLREILQFLRMVDRRERAEEFSFSRLMASLFQLLAVAALAWAVLTAIFSENVTDQIIRLLYALVLQLISLTLFVLSSRK